MPRLSRFYDARLAWYRLWAARDEYVITSRKTPTATTNHPTPDTPCTGPHASVYIRAVQGAKMIPSTGQIVDENAALTRPESNTQSRKKANRGPMKAIDRARQHIGPGILLTRHARVNSG